MTDTELIRRLQSGDRAALAHVYSTYAETALRTAFLITRDRSAAEDAVQQAFVQVMRTVANLRDPASFRPWFFQIVVNAAKRLSRINHQVAPDAPARTSRGLRLRPGPALEVAAACIVLAVLVGLAAFRNLNHTPGQAGGQQGHTPPPAVTAPKGAPWIAPDAQFAAPLADQLSRSGIAVIEVRRSIYESVLSPVPPGNVAEDGSGDR